MEVPTAAALPGSGVATTQASGGSSDPRSHAIRCRFGILLSLTDLRRQFISDGVSRCVPAVTSAGLPLG